MSGHWASSTRAARLPANWRAIRAQRLAMDGHRCTWLDAGQRCTEAATEVDHVKAMHDDNSLEALQSLCTPHHRLKSAREGGQARAKRYSEKRPREPHPGLG